MTHPSPIEAAAPGLAPALVAAFSDLQVLAILNHLPADRQAAILTGGFQLTPASAGNPQIRKRLARMLEQRPELLRWASEMTPAPWQETLQVLTMLDAAWLQQEWRSLVRSQALPHLLLAAAFCPERPGLQARACRWFRWRPATPRPVRPADPPTNWQAWQKLAGTAVATPPAPATEDVKKPAAEVPAANARLRKRLDEAEAARKEAEQTALQWKKQAKAAEHAQAALQKNAQANLESAVATARRELYGYSDDIGQLRQLLAAADQATEPFARQVLLRQAEINQRHGTRSALRQERQRLLALQQDLRLAIEESLVVLPELRQAAS